MKRIKIQLPYPSQYFALSAYAHPSVTPYAYCAANPVKLVDPDGRDAKVTINEDENTITITSNIIIYGDGASNETAQKYQNCIMQNWGEVNTYEYNGKTYKVIWDISTRVMEDGEEMDFNGVNNYINATNVLKGKSSSTTNTNTGMWRATSLNGEPLGEKGSDNPAAHEFGHILGLHDRYITKDQAKQTGWQRGTILQGWHGNIMAEPSGKGSVTKDNLDILFSPLLDINQYMPSLSIPYMDNSHTYKINQRLREPKFHITPKR